MQPQNPSTLLKRPNETIGVLPAGIHFSGQMRKLWAAIMLISQQQGKKEEYWAYLDDLCDIAGIANVRGKGRQTIKDNLGHLRKLDIEWRGMDGDTEVEKTFGAIIEHGFRSKPGSKLIVTWALSKKAQERLVNPSGFFTKMCLEILSKMRSGASVVLFEIACMYETHAKNDYKVGKRSVNWWMDQLTGREKSASLYGDFKRSVLKPALAEIGDHTGVELELIEIKEGKKISELDFRIVPKQNWSILDVKDDYRTIDGEVIKYPEQADSFNHKKRMIEIGLTPHVANQLIARYQDPSYIETHLSELEIAVKGKDNNIKNPPGRLRKALEENWQYNKKPAPRIRMPLGVSEETFSDQFKSFLELDNEEKVRIFETWAKASSASLYELYTRAKETKGFDEAIKDAIFRRSFEIYLKTADL